MERIIYNNRNKFLFSLLAALGCTYMVFFPSFALDATKRGVSLWVNSVLPALLPFFICSNFLLKMGVARAAGRLFEKPCRIIFGVSGKASFVFFSSIISGYPMGPKLIGDLYSQREISYGDAKRILSFGSTSGPLFMIGAVGTAMLGSAQLGMIIAASHYIGAILNGILFRFVNMGRLGGDNALYIGKKGEGKQPYDAQAKGTLLEMFTDSILSSLKTLGVICGFIVIFAIISDFFFVTGILEFVSVPAALRQNGWLDFISNTELRLLFSGMLEMTVGCNGLALSWISVIHKVVLCTFLISFGGLSIMAQSMSVLGECKISPLYYLAVKLSHGVLSALCAYALLSVYLPVLLSEFAQPAAGLF